MKQLCYGVSLGLLSLGLLASCSEAGTEEPVKPESQKSVLTFTTQLRGLSRASATEFESGDQISLFAVKGNATDSEVVLAESGNAIHNQKYSYDGAQFISDPQVYKSDSDSYAYFAVYPYSTEAGPRFDFAVNADQREYSDYTLSDLCTSTTGYTTESCPNLTFFHRLSNLQVTLEGNHLAGEMEVEFVNMATNVAVDLNSVSVTTQDNVSTIRPNEYGTNTWRAIVAPKTIQAGTPFVRVVLNGKEYFLSHNINIELGSGRQTNIVLKVINEEPVIVSGDIYPWNTGAEITYVVPEDILEKLDDHIDIFYGINPPNIEGCYFVDPLVAVYCEDEGNGGFEPGYVVNSIYTNFYDQNMIARTISFSRISVSQTSFSIGNGAFISGEGNNFSVFFDTEGETDGIYTKEAMVISGTKTPDGIKNLQYAFVMVDKGDDPENYLMDKGVYRVFKDEDGLAVNSSWPATFMSPKRVTTKTRTNSFDLIRRNK